MKKRKKKVKCKWVYDGDMEIYQTDCGKEFIITEDGTIDDMSMKFCCFCGKPLVEDRP